MNNDEIKILADHIVVECGLMDQRDAPMGEREIVVARMIWEALAKRLVPLHLFQPAPQAEGREA